MLCVLSSCGMPEDDPSLEEPIAASGEYRLNEGSLGTVRYTYDPAELTRAETDLLIPPAFEDGVFAVKFIPHELAERLGQRRCSFGPMPGSEDCSAGTEVGFALALLEQPFDFYEEMLLAADGDAVEPRSVKGVDGLSYVRRTVRATTRYTFLPNGERTLLLVDRRSSGTNASAEALEHLRDSIRFQGPSPQAR